MKKSLILCSLLLTAALSSSLATQVIPLTLTETVRKAQTIVVGTVLSKNTRWGTDAKRWMLTDYEVRVEEVVFPGEGTLPLKHTITVTYWGGSLEGKTHEVTDARLPVVGEHLLLMLKPGWQEEVSFSPVIGVSYGLFSVAPVQPGGPLIVHDANGVPLVRQAEDQVAWRSDRASEATLPNIDVSTFVAWLRANIHAIKAAPSELRPQAGPSDPRVMKVFAKTPSLSRSDRNIRVEERGMMPATERIVEVPLRPEFWTNAALAEQQSAPPGEPEYSFQKRADAPVTVNHFPSSFAPWSPEDQYQMTKWNYYADIFRVSGSPTGTFDWENGRWDLCGWPSSAQMQTVYGAPWDSDMVAICIRGWNSSNIILEADIALNPAFSFTLDDEWVFNGGSAQGFREVMTHELGHMWGLDHQFQFLAVMNYAPKTFRFFGLPYMDDAEGIRSAFPGQTMPRTDLGIYLYSAGGYQTVNDAVHHLSVAAGATLSVSNYHLENVGTTTVTTPTVEWYLTASRSFSGVTHYLGTSTHESLLRFQSINLANTSRSFTVPTNVAPGTYYLAAFIRNDGGATQGSFPFSNNYAFSRRTVQVTPAVGSLQVTINPAGAVSAGAQWQVDGGPFQNSGATVSNLSVGSHTVSFRSVSGWSTPSSQTVTVSANSTATTTGTYVAMTGSLQVTINPAGAVSSGAQWQVDGGTFQNSGATVSNLSVGNHTVAFKSVSGWSTPSNQTISVSANTTSTTTGTYVAVPTTGSLQVTINPAAAVSAGAQWQVDGGPFQNSGAIVSGLSAGDHTVSFKPVSGWTTPSNQIMPVTANTTNSTSGTYTAPPLQLLSAASTKVHGANGTFGINLPLAGTPAVECRTGGAGGTHTLVFTFSNNIVSGNATVTSGVGSVSGTPTINGNTMTVPLTGVANAQRVTLNLSNVTDTAAQVLAPVSVTAAFLVGDTTGNGLVSATDIGQVKSQSGQNVTASNFRLDVTASGGSINASDIGQVKFSSGSQLP